MHNANDKKPRGYYFGYLYNEKRHLQFFLFHAVFNSKNAKKTSDGIR